ncbi:protein kinase domain containing protein [Entamoeba histolytica HM-1:IMSS-B]|uniref:TLDc domain-containing protein n=6 Tax=Entamoeba histolytica TaxID=5759 RepID=C4M4X5_ENTH1|nr:hypothetical protein EHI_119260 [Entamoeba histolytica HM-1:IMSS]EMD49162.1 splicing factor arginine/serinerich, putative [Entamoeba histolytica KU27]EMH77123.1 protein kinase domain containing protein [Entamoeba histolytica HM-1:IMSS-B]EMS12881.1 splicing factor, arginine/serine-rich, putative [Entamoeba histolytica HM-3:IMSS]ENY62838.1 splicing factor, arginine/serine-rich, putative [Entamoeba histolytica HM-1:IMSS-A]GAT96442.1 hypothetical protein CL6EHI_119260 [Entamoeba histolytica]|eukprot:XP_650268.1 hypothetical protein EHI_119260 [Entamoeba histolytica HM-1:IMSS]
MKSKELINEYENYFKEWTQLNYFEEIYNNKKDGNSSADINRKIHGRKNILFLITTTEGWAFGAFIAGHIPVPSESMQYVKDTHKHFVFTLKNPFNIEPMILHRKKGKGMTLIVFPNSNIVYSLVIKKFCVIKKSKDENSVIHPEFNTKYEDPTQYSCCLFTGEDSINVDEIIAYQCS